MHDWTVVSPREAALRILTDRFRPLGPVQTTVPLAQFQKQSFEQASAILDRRNGVLIADSVGLGKTYVALALIEAALIRDQNVLVVVPACLRRMWWIELGNISGSSDQVRLISHTKLAVAGLPPAFEPHLVVVDEAHAFRNPHTRRYTALKHACRGSRVVLLTATPINNSLSDLYFQLRLFCSDGAFRDLGIGSLRSLLRDGQGSDLARLKRAVMVRRTRADARAELASAPTNEAVSFRFPRTAHVHALNYELPITTEQLADFLHRLTFPAYRPTSSPSFSPDVLRFGLLKRMESSSRAIRVTLQRQIRFYEQFIHALTVGMLLRPRTFRSLYAGDDDSVQLVLDAVALEPHSAAANRDALMEDARDELQVLRNWLAALKASEDHKLRQLIALIRSRGADAKTVVFTEYRDTARYLWSELRRRFAVALIDGSGAWIGETPSSRRHVVDCFAPRANHARRVHPREAVSVLVATDVLAEGMNLQDADAVVSYDLPWNPVRLIQRAGRVDRIGSDHDIVHVYNFIPDREFDAFLGLARTIRDKLETVREAVGTERAVLEPGEDFETVVRGIAAGSHNILGTVEGGSDWLRAEYLAAAPVVGGPVRIAALSTGQPNRLLIGLARGAEKDVRLIEADTFVERDDADSVLSRALEMCTCTPIDAAAVLARAENYVEDLNRRAECVAVSRTSVSARLARLLRNRLSHPMLDNEPATFKRADAVLEKLAKVTDPAVEFELERFTATAQSKALAQLLCELENAFSRVTISASESVRWTLTAVIAAD